MDQDSGDRDLAAALASGDTAALGELMGRHEARLRRILTFRLDPRLVGRVGVDDLVQEVYLAAASRLVHYEDGEHEPFLWLRLIAMQTLIDVHRHHLGVQMRDPRKERSVRGPSAGNTTNGTLAIHLVDSLTSPSQALARHEILARVEQALATLSEADQEIIALRHFEELGNAEAAQVLNIAVKAASIRYVRAVRRLKGALGDLSGFDLGRKL